MRSCWKNSSRAKVKVWRNIAIDRAEGGRVFEGQLPSPACFPGNRRGSARQPARNSVQRRESGPAGIGSCRRVLLGYRGARMRDVSTHHVLVTEPSRPDWGDNRRRSGSPSHLTVSSTTLLRYTGALRRIGWSINVVCATHVSSISPRLKASACLRGSFIKDHDDRNNLLTNEEIIVMRLLSL